MTVTLNYKSNFVRSQRRAAFTVQHAYRTVSNEASLLLAGMPPVDLQEQDMVWDNLIHTHQYLSNYLLKNQDRGTENNQWQSR